MQVHYADGDKQEEVLALERVRLLVHAGEELPLASACSLPATLAHLRKLHTGGEYARQPERRRLLQQRLAELTAYAAERYPAERQQQADRRRSLATPGPSGADAAASLHSTAAGAAATGSGGAIGRALALAARLPAGAKITSARGPGPRSGIAWMVVVRQLLGWVWEGGGGVLWAMHCSCCVRACDWMLDQLGDPSWPTLQIKYKSVCAAVYGLSREQAAVGSDLLTVWRRDGNRVPSGKPLPVSSGQGSPRCITKLWADPLPVRQTLVYTHIS